VSQVPVIPYDRFGEREKGSSKANTTMFYLSIVDLVLEVFIVHLIGEIGAFSFLFKSGMAIHIID
jgi:hypothetical protein